MASPAVNPSHDGDPAASPGSVTAMRACPSIEAMTKAAAEPGASQTPSARGGLALPVGVVVVGATVIGTVIPVMLHQQRHCGFNVHQIAMAFFFWLNVIIAYWEICLFFRIDEIRGQYEGWRDDYRGRELDRVIELFGSPLPLREWLSMRRWGEIWSSYSLFDESYSNKTSFGFFIDIGNGFTTLLPSLLFVYGITFQVVSARALGIMGLIISYQMFYGTVVYFTSFVMNRRYRGHRMLNLATFVGLSNGLWISFPLWAMWLCISMIYSDSYAMFGG